MGHGRFELECQACGTRLRVPASDKDITIRCPSCGSLKKIPMNGGESHNVKGPMGGRMAGINWKLPKIPWVAQLAVWAGLAGSFVIGQMLNGALSIAGGIWTGIVFAFAYEMGQSAANKE